jgi:hypothetical protein
LARSNVSWQMLGTESSSQYATPRFTVAATTVPTSCTCTRNMDLGRIFM